MKKTAFLLSFVLLTVFSVQTVSAADYNFQTEPYDDFYQASSAQVISDGNGHFSVVPESSTISSDDGYVTVISPPGKNDLSYDPSEPVSSPMMFPSYPDLWQGGGTSGGNATPAAQLMRSDGSIGDLEIPAIKLSVKIYEGESLANMSKGTGHFSSTSAWDGNVAIAGHNRGSSAWFGRLKELRVGDIIYYRTNLGLRSYRVSYAGSISNSDISWLNGSNQNMLTLITCVENISSLRLCIRAIEF